MMVRWIAGRSLMEMRKSEDLRMCGICNIKEKARSVGRQRIKWMCQTKINGEERLEWPTLLYSGFNKG